MMLTRAGNDEILDEMLRFCPEKTVEQVFLHYENIFNEAESIKTLKELILTRMAYVIGSYADHFRTCFPFDR